MQKNMETEQLSGISALHQWKKTIRDGRASKEYQLKKKKRWFSEILKVSSVLQTKNFFRLALQSNNKNNKILFFLKTA